VSELSRQLADMGRKTPPVGLGRIESGERRLDVDVLIALAVALGVSPTTLLTPDCPPTACMRIPEWSAGDLP
jgi:transcriptional regulator with XRE-family HTH domain